jgi:Domain of unknown function (DUF2828)
LLPAQLVKAADMVSGSKMTYDFSGEEQTQEEKEAYEDEANMVNAQWNTVVERVRRSGKLSSSIAVCDVSGSMLSPVHKDRTVPMESAIGLSLLLSEVTEAPFGGNIIAFSEEPSFITVGGPRDDRSFVEKIEHIHQAPAGFSTNFVAVFEKLILPMAVRNKLKQEEMVKQVFVFSDMQFNAAETSSYNAKSGRWTTSYKRIKNKFESAGYKMPQMIFWNLAGRQGGVPVVADEPGTAMISGYSQAQMKIFLDEGGFEDEPLDPNQEYKKGKESKAERMSSTIVVGKAISHKSFAMLKVYD